MGAGIRWHSSWKKSGLLGRTNWSKDGVITTKAPFVQSIGIRVWIFEKDGRFDWEVSSRRIMSNIRQRGHSRTLADAKRKAMGATKRIQTMVNNEEWRF